MHICNNENGYLSIYLFIQLFSFARSGISYSVRCNNNTNNNNNSYNNNNEEATSTRFERCALLMMALVYRPITLLV